MQSISSKLFSKNIIFLYYIRLLLVIFKYLILVIYNFFFFSNKGISSNVRRESNLTQYFFLKIRWNFLNSNVFFNFIDLLYILFQSNKFKLSFSNNYSTRILVRLRQVNWKFYKHVNFLSFYSFYSGIRYIWVGLKYWLVGLILGLFAFYYLTYIRLLPFNKIMFEWLLIIMFLYWLLSGFVFFIKKYQYSKFTTVIQRFWKRSFMLFWLIEGGVFVVFFYLTLTAAEEPVYMYDQMKLFKNHLFSWRWFLVKILPVISLIILSYFLLLCLKWNTFNKQSLFFLVITLILIFVFWLGFYQFFHIINFFGNLVWVYDLDEFLWNLEIEFRRTRICNNLLTICLLAKFWHLVFIFVFWVFLVLRINEIGRARYILLSANYQNFVILYLMSWLYMYPWLKFLFKRHYENAYYWFFLNARRLGLRVFVNDLRLFISSLASNIELLSYSKFSTGNFFYWISSSEVTGFSQYKKFLIRDYIILILNS